LHAHKVSRTRNAFQPPYITFTETLMDLLEGLDTSGDLSHVEIASPEGS
jgi:hypothetical protein